MYRLFLVGAKLLGIYFLVEAITVGLTVLSGGKAAIIIPAAGVNCLINFLAGTALLFGSKGVAALARIREYDDELPAIRLRTALTAGIVLIGLWNFMRLLPNFVWLVLTHSTKPPQSVAVSPEILGGQLLALAVSVLLMVSANRMAGLLDRANRHEQEPPA